MRMIIKIYIWAYLVLRLIIWLWGERLDFVARGKKFSSYMELKKSKIEKMKWRKKSTRNFFTLISSAIIEE